MDSTLPQIGTNSFLVAKGRQRAPALAWHLPRTFPTACSVAQAARFRDAPALLLRVAAHVELSKLKAPQLCAHRHPAQLFSRQLPNTGPVFKGALIHSLSTFPEKQTQGLVVLKSQMQRGTARHFTTSVQPALVPSISTTLHNPARLRTDAVLLVAPAGDAVPRCADGHARGLGARLCWCRGLALDGGPACHPRRSAGAGAGAAAGVAQVRMPAVSSCMEGVRIVCGRCMGAAQYTSKPSVGSKTLRQGANHRGCSKAWALRNLCTFKQ